MSTHDSINTWLAKPHTMTWFQMVRTGKIPPDVLATVGPEREPHTAETAMTVAMALAQTHTRWPTIEQYFLAVPCRTSSCKASVGQPCTVVRTDCPWHATRQTLGIRRRGKDVGNAPWGEDRIPGKIYSDLTPKGRS